MRVINQSNCREISELLYLPPFLSPFLRQFCFRRVSLSPSSVSVIVPAAPRTDRCFERPSEIDEMN